MKLNPYRADISEKMSEFDLWVTPSLGEIRDDPQFQTNLQQLKKGFDLLARFSNDFINFNSCSPKQLTEKIMEYSGIFSEADVKTCLSCIWNVLFLSTGKTDNNIKCQFPIYLQNVLGVDTYEKKTKSGKTKRQSFPRVITTDDVTTILLCIKDDKKSAYDFLSAYISLILSDTQYCKQLWSLGKAYIQQKNEGDADSLLTSIAVFQSRGSITATQGHIPEKRLREYMVDWGLVPDLDFNIFDVEIGELLGDIEVDDKIKKRKYDFIIPYRTRENGKKIFIQSQFYAGDSGSVSHKVVDQTDSSRSVTKQKYPDAVFVEYLDGAGYYASLNGDLKKMLSKATTKEFFQIRTAPLKLRRELQEICFLTVLELEHAIIKTLGNPRDVEESLINDGYCKDDIHALINDAISRGLVIIENGNFKINDARKEIVRRYCLLDIIANYGEPIPYNSKTGVLYVAGYKSFWGLSQTDVVKIASERIPGINSLWESVVSPIADIQWLLDKQFVKVK